MKAAAWYIASLTVLYWNLEWLVRQRQRWPVVRFLLVFALIWLLV